MRASLLLAVLLLGMLPLAAEESPAYHLALTIQKLEKGFEPPRPLRILAVGDRALMALGDGTGLRTSLLPRFPHCPPIELHSQTGPAATWAQCLEWTREGLDGDPDLVIVYATGKPADLDALLADVRTRSTADLLVPSIHWRAADAPNWGRSENAPDQDVAVLRETCSRHGAEMVENRKHWATHLKEFGASINSLLQDKTQPSAIGRALLRKHVLAHLVRSEKYSYTPRTRERRVKLFLQFEPGEDFQLPFTGRRIDLLGHKFPDGGTAQVFINNKPIGEISFTGEPGKLFRATLAEKLANQRHLLRLQPAEGKTLGIRGFEIYEPPVKSTPPHEPPAQP